MHRIFFFISLLFAVTFTGGCSEKSNEKNQAIDLSTDRIQAEKAAVLAVLNAETKAAFTRDYRAWQAHWVHRSDIGKTYIDFRDSTMTETIGWSEIDDFVRTYLENHPEPAPLPDPLTDIDLRLYGTGAWVSYEQTDPQRGKKRETRLMEKENGKWKIAGMHTTIYGF